MGVPAPAFGITNADAQTYGAAEGYAVDGSGRRYTYYVDKDHPSATNTSNPNGSPSTPRLTWPYPLAAGDIVLVAGTGYSFNNAPHSAMAAGGTGTAADPIWVRGIPTAQSNLTSVTADASSNVISAAGHSVEWGDPVIFVSGTGFGGLVAGTTYYAREVVAGVSFKLMATIGYAGTVGVLRESVGNTNKAIDITSAGSSGVFTPLKMPEINRADSFYVYGDFCITEGFRLVNDCRFNTRPGIDGSSGKEAPVISSVVRHCVVEGNGDSSGASAFSTGGSSGNSADNYTLNLVVWDCLAFNLGNWQLDVEDDNLMAVFSENATNCWLVDSEGFHINGDGSRLGADQGGTASGGFYYLGRVYFWENKENGVDIKQADNAVISSVLMHTFPDSSTSGGEAVVIHYDGSNVWFVNCRIYDCIRGMVTTGVDTGLYIVGCVLFDISDIALYLDRGGGDLHAINNTIHDCANGIVSTGTITSIESRNNNVYDITGSYLRVENTNVTGHTDTVVANDNYFESGGGAVSIRWGATTYTTSEAFDTAQAKASNIREVDPEFTNAAGRIYTLVSTSDLIDVGSSWTALNTTFGSVFGGASLLTDGAGVSRPQSGTFDVNALEFDASAPTLPPAAPSNLAANQNSSSAITLTWDDNASDETSQEIQISTVGSGSGFSALASVAANIETYQATGLLAATQYFFRIRATNGNGSSAFSSEANDTTDAAVVSPPHTQPNTPENFTAHPVF